jgi:hypothetical protein
MVLMTLVSTDAARHIQISTKAEEMWLVATDQIWFNKLNKMSNNIKGICAYLLFKAK